MSLRKCMQCKRLFDHNNGRTVVHFCSDECRAAFGGLFEPTKPGTFIKAERFHPQPPSRLPALVEGVKAGWDWWNKKQSAVSE